MKKVILLYGGILCLLLCSAGSEAKWRPVWADYVAEGNKEPIAERIELEKLGPKGVKILHAFSGQPSRFGMLGRYELVLPEFSRGCYFSGDHHPEGKHNAGFAY